MATMSDTGSSFAQWAGLYHHDVHDPIPALPLDHADDAFAAAASPTSGRSSGSPTKASAQHQHQQLLHGVEGPRAGKPARRRSRASRRAPVTLLNTDTANFRAMVQQFTGIPAPPAGTAFGLGVGGPLINFAAADYGLFPPASAAAVSMSFDHRGHVAPQPLQEQLLRRQQQQYIGGYSNGGGDVFGLASAEDRMLLQSIQAAQMPPPPSAANTATASGFFA